MSFLQKLDHLDVDTFIIVFWNLFYFNWLIFDGMSTRIGLVYNLRLKNRIHYTFILYIFCVDASKQVFLAHSPMKYSSSSSNYADSTDFPDSLSLSHRVSLSFR